MLNHTLTHSAALEEIVRRFAPRDRAGMPLTPDTRLVDDFGIDSPRMIDVVLEVEDRFGITVDDDAMGRVRTFGEVLTLVEKLAGGVS